MRIAVGFLAASVLVLPALAFGQNNPPTPPPAQPAANDAAPTGTGVAKTPPAPTVKTRPLSEQPMTQEQRPARPRGTGKAWKKKDKDKDRVFNGPIATFPGFRMVEGGGSRVVVEVSRHVDVSENKAQGRLVYRLKGAQAPTRTNRLPLLTGFFTTPVSKIQLVDEGPDVEVVIDLRQATTPAYRVVDNANGMVLQIDFPKVEAVEGPKVADPGTMQKQPHRPATDTTRINDQSGAY